MSFLWEWDRLLTMVHNRRIHEEHSQNGNASQEKHLNPEDFSYLEEEFEENNLPEHACRYCFAQNPECVAKCNICNKWFCNGQPAGLSSHIVNHLVRSRHMELSLHPESPLGDSALECYTCGCKNVFQLGFVPADADGVVVLICRDVCLHATSTRDSNSQWQIDQWQPLVENKSLLPWLARAPTADEISSQPYRELSLKTMRNLEVFWRSSSTQNAPSSMTALMLEDCTDKIPLRFESDEQYRKVFRPLITLESEFARLTRFQNVQVNTEVTWSVSSHKTRVAIFDFAADGVLSNGMGGESGGVAQQGMVEGKPSLGDRILISHPKWKPSSTSASSALIQNQQHISSSSQQQSKKKKSYLISSLREDHPSANSSANTETWSHAGTLLRIRPDGFLIVDMEVDAACEDGPWSSNISSGFEIRCLWREATQERMLSALDAFVDSKAAIHPYIKSAILGTLPKETPGNKDNKHDALYPLPPQKLVSIPSESIPGLSDLNYYQRQAVLSAVTQRLTLIQGPPGTGKTTTSAAAVFEMVRLQEIALSLGLIKKKHAVLVVAPSNTAADHLAERINRTGLGVVRLCSKSREVAIDDEIASLEPHAPPPGSALSLTLNWILKAAASNGTAGTKKSFEGDHSRRKRKQHPAEDEEDELVTLTKEMHALKRRLLVEGSLPSRLLSSLRSYEKKSTRAVLSTCDVIVTTCSTAADPRLKGFEFSQVLVDESAQATEPECLIPLVSGCQQVVFVGDHCQLSPVVLSPRAASAGLSQSLFERLVLLGIKPHRLEVQYRMHPSLAAFPSSAFYDGALQNGVTLIERTLHASSFTFNWPNAQHPMFFYNCHTVEEISSSGISFVNRGESAIVEKLIIQFIKDGLKGKQIGIITPYSGQRTFLVNTFQRLASSSETSDINEFVLSQLTDVEVASVDAFQGREKDVIIFSCVRSNDNQTIGFLADSRRLNVALTRAKCGLVIVGNARSLAAANIRGLKGKDLMASTPNNDNNPGFKEQQNNQNFQNVGHVWLNLLNHFKRNDLIVEGSIKSLLPCPLHFASAVHLPSRYTGAASMALVDAAGEAHDETHDVHEVIDVSSKANGANLLSGGTVEAVTNVATALNLNVMSGYGEGAIRSSYHQENSQIAAEEKCVLDSFTFGSGF
eukprot:GDKJ01056892.1.p1 GENE.GDKJ01056892.1~~GDKJ01056892.1.p1  ORF type:complete len:1147 (-),score=287.37 GDKJ01056892.1:371-3811(-)